jgi:transposase
MDAITVGLDIAKSVFHVHVVDGSGKALHSKKLRRSQVEPFFVRLPRAVVGIEACATAHHWARVLRALGHEVRLIPAAYVKPFVRRNKNDARDAEGICEAVGRPAMTFVPIKTVEQQAARGLERARDLLSKQHKQLRNCMRSQLAELGITAAKGERGFASLVARLNDAELPDEMKAALHALMRQIEQLAAEIIVLEKRIVAAARQNPVMRLLATIPGVGPITAHAVVTAIGDGRQFRSARDFAAWCGLTPREYSSAGKRREKGISRQGERRLRTLFALGASTIIRTASNRVDRATAWQRGILARRPVKVAVLAQAAKTARIAWAMLVSGETYRSPVV